MLVLSLKFRTPTLGKPQTRTIHLDSKVNFTTTCYYDSISRIRSGSEISRSYIEAHMLVPTGLKIGGVSTSFRYLQCEDMSTIADLLKV